MNDWLLLSFDILILFILLGLAWLTCNTKEIKRGVTLFVAFGLLLAVIWARLKAPDLALAEAIIGAGISGALLLKAMRDYTEQTSLSSETSRFYVWGINAASLALFVLLAWGLWHALERSDGVRLAENVLITTPESGVSHPVTAVLLNFRAYDTLLELAVVFTAVLVVLAMGTKQRDFGKGEPILIAMVRWLAPILIVTSGYLLWVGAHAPGGAFQAGAMLAAAFILMSMTGVRVDSMLNDSSMRWLLVIGIGVFTITGIVMLLINGHFLAYSKELAKMLILLIEAAATLSIAAALTLAYLGGMPKPQQKTQSAVKIDKTEEGTS
ncbi:MAG: FIG00856669: hypothetical protein [uncultured Thiotrichaceae bacterium]|uniref:Sodium:proton antiporter n=1 Tax=uncultured Thiotrichaceae bacterium TaxID=298394 RepID=A0A6S6SR98_9GAMM|nr:MAG: FIG00856669: hypothetical protein [uncultured Thiotrichaceae bacterium]